MQKSVLKNQKEKVGKEKIIYKEVCKIPFPDTGNHSGLMIATIRQPNCNID